MWRGIPLPSRLGVCGIERRKLPPAGSGAEPRRKKRFYCFLSVSERLSLQRLLKINVVHSRPLIDKNGFAQWIGSDALRQRRRYFLQFLCWQVDENRFRLERSFEALNAILRFNFVLQAYLAGFLEC